MVTATVPRCWPGSTIVCIGGGPSLTADDVDACRGRARVIAVNDAYRLAPWADVLYAHDLKWWEWHNGCRQFAGLRYSMMPAAAKYGVQILRNTGFKGLERDPGGLKNGLNSGYQAINLAVHLGAARIVLLGYDMQPDGRNNHWFGNHPLQTRINFTDFIAHLNALAPLLEAAGIDVLNATRRTALRCFPCAPLAECLEARIDQAS